MPMKPSILKGIESILGSKKVESFVNDADDYMIIEDDSGRIRVAKQSLVKDFSISHFITGIVSSCKGRIDDRGLFIIEDMIFNRVSNYNLPKRINISFKTDYSLNGSSVYQILSSNNNLIAFISGLKFGNIDYTGKSALARNLFIDLIQGKFAVQNNLNNLFKRIVRIVIVGNSIFSPDETDLVEKGSFIKQDLNSRVYRTLLQNYDEFDNFLNILSHSVKLDVMPGASDTSCIFFPQLPINNIMLPLSYSSNSINLVPNPYKFEFDELLFLGSSGQNIDNIRRYTTISKNSSDIMEKTIDWCHISPSSPDTLRTYPITQNDPLLFREIPNVYFTGNQKNFETKLIEYNGSSIRLFSVPEFSATFSFVLMDMKTLEVCEYLIQFKN
jgi:DNA polymerase delta subunit 2